MPKINIYNKLPAVLSGLNRAITGREIAAYADKIFGETLSLNQTNDILENIGTELPLRSMFSASLRLLEGENREGSIGSVLTFCREHMQNWDLNVIRTKREEAAEYVRLLELNFPAYETLDFGDRYVRHVFSPHHLVSSWRNYWQHEADHEHLFTGDDGVSYPAYEWIQNRKILVSIMPGVDQSVVPYVQKGIEEMAREIGLHIGLEYIGANTKYAEFVTAAINNEGKIDPVRLSSIIAADRFKHNAQTADVIITGKYFSDGDQNWGDSMFSAGRILFALPGERQNSLGFIERLAKHEAGHMFGLSEHHDITVVNGYPEIQDCNMLWRASTLKTCPKCLDALKYFWKGIEDRTGGKYTKEHNLIS